MPALLQKLSAMMPEMSAIGRVTLRRSLVTMARGRRRPGDVRRRMAPGSSAWDIT